VDPIDLAFAGAARQVGLLASGAVTAPELVELYLDRIDRLDPQLNAFRVVRTDQVRRAVSSEIEAARPWADRRPPLS
jgi:amidase